MATRARGEATFVTCWPHIRPIDGQCSTVMFEAFAEANALAWRNIVKDGRPNRNVRCCRDTVARNAVVHDGMVMGDDAG